MASNIKVVRTDSFIGGLNLRADPFQLADNESPDLLNVNVDPRGGFSMRGGFERWNTAAVGAIGAGLATPRSMYAWNAATPQILLGTNGTIYYAAAGVFATTGITYVADPRFAPWDKVLYIARRTDPRKWTGAAAVVLTASAAGAWQESYASPTGTHMPRADFIATHVDRMWVARTNEDGTSYPNRVRFSHPGFPESWRSQDYIDVMGGGEGITALVPFKGALYVFKSNSIHAIYGYDTDTFQLVTITEALGVPNSNCVVTTEEGLWFFDWPDGLHLFDGSEIIDLFEKIRPLVREGRVSEAYLDQVWLSYTNAKVWLSLPVDGATKPNHTYVFDPSIKAWTLYQCFCGNSLGPATDFVTSTGTRLYLAAHPTQPYVLKLEQEHLYQDNITGTPSNFTSYFKTKWVDGGVTAARKMWRRPSFVVKVPNSDTALGIEVYHDWTEGLVRRSGQLLLKLKTAGLVWAAEAAEPDGIAGWGEAAWGESPTGSMYARGANLGLARAVQLKVSGPGGKPWGVNSITYPYSPRRVR